MVGTTRKIRGGIEELQENFIPKQQASLDKKEGKMVPKRPL